MSEPAELPADMLPNWSFVGRCYDVLLVDPLDIAKGATFQMAFTFDQFDSLPDGTASKPAATDHLPAPGGSYDQRITEISSSYDYRTFLRGDGSVTVSDPTGGLFSASLSVSCSQARKDIGDRGSVVTYTSEKVSLYMLRLREDRPPPLSAELAGAVRALPAEAGPAYQALIKSFGTHYARRVRYGGRATQRIVVNRVDYESFLEQGVDLKADVAATFEVAKVHGRAGVEDKRSRQFKSSQGVTVESIVYSGGSPQQMFDMWATTVRDTPAPIEVELAPLYELLTPERCRDDPALDAKRERLESAITAYLAKNGTDPSAGLMRLGDAVSLTLVCSGPGRYLSGANAKWTRTAFLRDTNGPGPHGLWTLVDAKDIGRSAPLKRNDIVALKSAASALYLDAQRGADATYDPGAGLTAATATKPDAASAQWRVELVSATGRDEVIGGDYVRFRSLWRGPDDEFGYLLGEMSSQDQFQRVYSFGRPKQRGTIWRLSRVPHQTEA